MNLLRQNPVLAPFGCPALGYPVGRLRVGPVQLDGICGTLIVALLIDGRHVSVDADGEDGARARFIRSPANLDDLDDLDFPKIGHHLRQIFAEHRTEWEASRAS
ncbi:hypothetical protein [Kitasatospora sp. MAA19]|uniref:hypothetical protein n=1 Tax=Kitasatospora sp. MAA19 TaxID=3035090 RepID=UPI0024771923|nr:hypothetical protein [Kitasatospora sp. MAA19]